MLNSFFHNTLNSLVFIFKYLIKNIVFMIPMLITSIFAAVFESDRGGTSFYNRGAFGVSAFFGFIVTGLYITHSVFAWKGR
jgi:hypothetical protein